MHRKGALDAASVGRPAASPATFLRNACSEIQTPNRPLETVRQAFEHVFYAFNFTQLATVEQAAQFKKALQKFAIAYVACFAPFNRAPLPNIANPDRHGTRLQTAAGRFLKPTR